MLPKNKPEQKLIQKQSERQKKFKKIIKTQSFNTFLMKRIAVQPSVQKVRAIKFR